VSSEIDTRPCFYRFQTLMERMDAMSVDWWAEAIPACHDALVESRLARLDLDLHGGAKAEEELARWTEREAQLKRLAEHFREMRDRNRLPR
jgi:hypothetical protein